MGFALQRLGWWWVVILFPLVVVVYVLVAAVAGGCLSEQRWAAHDLGGYDFVVSEEDCDFIAKEAFVRVLAAKTGDSRRVVLFEYVPSDYPDPLPEISVSGSRIKISISKVNAVNLNLRHWRWGDIDYEVGRIEFPSAGSLK